MQDTTRIILTQLKDCIEFGGYTQSLSAMIIHKLNSDQRNQVIEELNQFLNS